MRYKTQNWYNYKLFAYVLCVAISACSSGSGDGVNDQAPDGSIDTPVTDMTINVGDSLDFTATGSDPDGNLPLTYLWSFGAGSGIADATSEDPGLTQFNSAGVFTVSFTVTDSLGLADPTPDVRIITVLGPPQVLPKTGWSLLFVDSEELIAEDGAAVNAFDDDPLTEWRAAYFPASTPHPHEIQINLGGAYHLSGFRQLPRQDGSVRGRIKSYEFYVSLDGINWGTPVASGIFPNSAAEQEILFSPVQAAFVRFVALSEFLGGNLTSMAELTLLGDPATANLAPNGTIDTPLENLIINISDTLDFNGTASDFEGNLPFTYLWNFGAGSGIAPTSNSAPSSITGAPSTPSSNASVESSANRTSATSTVASATFAWTPTSIVSPSAAAT